MNQILINKILWYALAMTALLANAVGLAIFTPFTGLFYLCIGSALFTIYFLISLSVEIIRCFFRILAEEMFNESERRK